jgi:hypothetical protein
MTEWQSVNFIDEWLTSGHFVEILEVDYRDPELAEHVIITSIKEGSFDLFISACDDHVVSKSIADALARKGLPSLLICFDNLSVPFKHKVCCKFFDLVWLTSSETRYLFDKWKAKTIFMPYAANPFKYYPCNGPEIGSVSFLGTCYGSRLAKIEDMVKRGINIELYGGNYLVPQSENPAKNMLRNMSSSIKNIGRLASFEIGRRSLVAAAKKSFNTLTLSDEMKLLVSNASKISFSQASEVHSRSMASLNISELWNTYLLKKPVHKLHLRTFEIPMSGGLQIASRTNEILEYFEENKEIILYDDMDELVEKLDFYLAPDKVIFREELKQSARKRAIAEHSWMCRFSKVFSELGVH